MDLFINDNISHNYEHRWLDDELKFYFEFLEIHYKLLEFRRVKKIELKSKFHKLSNIELNEKLNEMENRKFSKKFDELIKSRYNSFTD